MRIPLGTIPSFAAPPDKPLASPAARRENGGGIRTRLIGSRPPASSELETQTYGARMKRLVAVVSVALTVVVSPGCSVFPDPPPRPANVPPDSVRLGGPKAYWWAKCTYQSGVDLCSVWNSGGELLESESGQFLPYDGGAAVAQPDLVIVPDRSGLQVLRLENGRILLLARAFQSQKQDLDQNRGGGR